MHTTRFAPSPNGRLHLGHAFAALTAARAADGGRFLLRIEDLDPSRARPEFIAGIEEDLAWLGLGWEKPVLRQSTRFEAYGSAVAALAAERLLYPCFCTRKDIAAEIAGASVAPRAEDAAIYPGICRGLSVAERDRRIALGHSHVTRLDCAKAAARLAALSFTELGEGPKGERGAVAVDPALLGDIVIARKDTPVAYHLAVVLDDAFQGVTLVTRGKDLFPATHVQRLLQALLALPAPLYAHHSLILDAEGRKYSKRDRAVTLQSLRNRGVGGGEIRRRLGFAG
ncbi:MAG TPA: tRNA glutamyl-Q(34) synthetase GluQRS [Steroidobacteraceae bacterium]